MGIFRRIKRKEGPRVKLCPKCLSPDLSPAFSTSGWLGGSHYRCRRCGYSGPVFVEVNPEEVSKEELERARAAARGEARGSAEDGAEEREG
ncbi:MAG: hypothetical protein Kow0069_37400 [Promethearchaeota archaeon]